MQSVWGTVNILSLCIVMSLMGCGSERVAEFHVTAPEIVVENTIPDITKSEDTIRRESASLILENKEDSSDKYTAYFYEVEGNIEVNIDNAETNLVIPHELYDFIKATAEKDTLSDKDWKDILVGIQSEQYGLTTATLFLWGKWSANADTYNNILMIGEDEESGGLVFCVDYDEKGKPASYTLNQICYENGKVIEKTRAKGRLDAPDYKTLEDYIANNAGANCNDILHVIAERGVAEGAKLCVELQEGA